MKAPMAERQWSSALPEALCWLVIVALPLVQALRGLDLTDTGFVAVNQSLFFAHPDRVAYWFHLWLTNLIGASVLAVTGESLLALRLGAAVIFWLTVYGVWSLFRGEIGRVSFLAVVAGLAAFDFAGKINIIHYNNLSLLFFVLGVAFLAKSSLSGRWPWSFVAGFVLAANAFVRLPNLLGLGLVLLPPLVALLTGGRRSPLRWGLSQSLSFALGALVGGGLLLGLMGLLGQGRLYGESLGFLTADAVSGEHYSLKGIIKRTLRDGLGALSLGALFVGLSVGLSFLTKRLVPRWLGLSLQAGVFVLALWIMGVIFVNQPKWLYWLPVGVTYWAAFYFFLRRKDQARPFLLTLLCAAVVFLMGIGSDTGNKVSTYAVLLAGPGVYLAARALATKISIGSLGTTIIMGLALTVVPTVVVQVYRDAPVPEVWIDRGPAFGILTTEVRWTVVQEAVEAVQKYAPPGSDLLAIDSLPLIHFLSGTRPYLDNPWPALFTEKEIERALFRHRGDPLPPVLVAKRNPRDPRWPTTDEPPTTSDAIDHFLLGGHYQTVWENQGFLLLQPQNTGESD